MNEIRFSLFGFPVIVQPQFWMLAGVYLLFGLQMREPLWSILSFVGVVFVSILIHELGHAFSCRRFSLQVLHIQLHGFGGEVLRRPGTNWQNLLVSLAGPGAGILFGLVVMFFAPFVLGVEGGPLEVLIGQLLWVNIGWSIMNLLPIAPLDGGIALGSFLALFSPRMAWPITWCVGGLLGVGIGMLGFISGSIFIGAVGGYFGYNNIQAFRKWRAVSR